MDTQNTNGKKKTAAVAAVVLALLLLAGGGTYAYLQDKSGEVSNSFATNRVQVSLSETTGSEYNIVPGAGEEKDPVVTVTATVDSYVFVTVTDSTDGLVSYTIADGWEALAGYDGVYYRTVSASGEAQSFSVLAGDRVYYSSALTNDDMVDENGNLLTDVQLTFRAYAIQAEPFDKAAIAYIAATGDTVEVKNGNELMKAIQKGNIAKLTTDIYLHADSSLLAAENGVLQENVVIDLDGHMLNYGYGGDLSSITSITATEDASLYIANGTLKVKVGDAASTAVFLIQSGGSVTLNNVTAEAEDNSLFLPLGDSATVNVLNSTIKAKCYCVSTNANSADNYGVVINIVNSTLEAERDTGDNCPVLINVPGTLNIDNSTITGQRQAVVVRAGTANITDSRLVLNGTYSNVSQYYSSDWQSGNEVPAAALVVGNQNGPYNANAVCTLTNTEVTANTDDGYALVYVDSNSSYSAALTATGVNFTESDVTTGSGTNHTVTVS